MRENDHSQLNRAKAAVYHPMVTVLLALCAGIMVDRYIELPLTLWWCLTAAWLLVWFVFWKSGTSKFAAWCLLCSLATLAGSWHHLAWYQFAGDEAGRFGSSISQPVCLQAIVSTPPHRIPAVQFNPMNVIPSTDISKLEVKLVAIRSGQTFRPISGRASLIVQGHLLGIQRGEQIQVFGKMKRIEHAKNPLEFDSAEYHRAQKILVQISSSYPDCIMSNSGGRTSVLSWIDRTRSLGETYLNRALDKQNAALASAILLGVRDSLDQQQSQTFMETGTFHLLAISGFHVGILAGGFFLLMKMGMISHRKAILLIVVTVIFYALLSGGRAPVIRASVIILVICAGLYYRRRPLGFNTLATAGVIILALNPTELFRTGTQLSFLAVASLIFIGSLSITQWRADPQQWLEYKNRSVFKRMILFSGRWVLLLMFSGTAIWLVTLPLVMARFHLISPVSILLNTFLWIPMAIALASGFCLMLLSWPFPALASLFASVCNSSLNLVTDAISIARDTPGGFAWVSGPDNWWLIGFYSLLMVFFAARHFHLKQFSHWKQSGHLKRSWLLTVILLWVAVGFSASIYQKANRADQLDCTFVSVGHGCSVIVELPNGKTLLYDAGHLGNPSVAARRVASCLWSRGITHLDAIVISHADADHYNAIPQLLEKFSVGVVYVSPMMFEEQSLALKYLQQSIRNAGIPIREIYSGQQIDDPQVNLSVLHPDELGVLGRNKDNANSIVLDLQYQGRSILLTGDLEGQGLQRLMDLQPKKYHIILAPHHGSVRSSPQEFAKWAAADWVVISGGSKHLQSDKSGAFYEQAGSRVFHTSEGAVRFSINQNRIDIKKIGR